MKLFEHKETLKELESKKRTLFSKAMKMMPNSKQQMAVREELDQISKKIEDIKNGKLKEASDSLSLMPVAELNAELKPISDWLKKKGYSYDKNYSGNVSLDKKHESYEAYQNGSLRVMIFRGQIPKGKDIKNYFEVSVKTVKGGKYYHEPAIMSSFASSKDVIKVLEKHLPEAENQLK